MRLLSLSYRIQCTFMASGTPDGVSEAFLQFANIVIMLNSALASWRIDHRAQEVLAASLKGNQSLFDVVLESASTALVFC